MRYIFDIDGVEIELSATSMDDAIDEAEDSMDYSQYENDGRPVFWAGLVLEVDEDGDVLDSRSVDGVLHPPEPECDGDDHDLVQTSVWGHGGGVIIRSRCRCCGREVEEDTWASNPVNGTQGWETRRWLEAA